MNYDIIYGICIIIITSIIFISCICVYVYYNKLLLNIDKLHTIINEEFNVKINYIDNALSEKISTYNNLLIVSIKDINELKQINANFNNKTSISIYILKLEQDKYYVGRTSNILNRINKHIQNEGAVWTKKYKMLSIYTIIDNCDIYDEDKYVIKMMNEYGIENVRGGSFTTIKLENYQINYINKSIANATNKCFKCGKSGHVANECLANQQYDPFIDE